MRSAKLLRRWEHWICFVPWCVFLLPMMCYAAPKTCSSDEQNKVLAAHQTGKNSWVDCTGPYRQDFSLPSNARLMPFHRRLLTSAYGGYPQDVTTFDIVWMEDTINVTEPLRSFGGDIILFADTVNINATIDSRVYIEHDVDIFAPGDPNYVAPSTVKTGRWRTNDATNQRGIIGVKAKTEYINAYNDYYLKCFDCIVTKLPQLPSGLAASSVFGIGFPDILRFDGDPAPDNLISFPDVRSGNIYIFARSVNIAPDVSHPVTPAYRAECTNSPTRYVPYAINAGGLAGGRGGAGSASKCINHNTLPDCLPEGFTMTGGLTGPGGRGGDAGNVFVTLLQSAPSPQAANTVKSQLTSVVNVQGGNPGSNQKYRTPSAEGPAQSDGTRCSFREDTPAGQYAAATAGSGGTFDVQPATPAAALSVLASYLAAKDMRSDYDYYYFLNIAKADQSFDSVRLSSSLSEYLSGALVKAEIRFAQDADRVFGLEIGEEQQQYLPPSLVGLGKDPVDEAPFAEQQLSIIRELRTYDDPSDGLLTVLRRTGGMFHVDSRDKAVTRMSSGQLRVELAQVHGDLAQIKDELRDIHALLFSHFTAAQQSALQQRISTLKAEIDKAEQEAQQRAQNDQGLLPLVNSLQKFGQAVAGLATAYSSDDYVGVAQGLKNTFEAFQSLTSLQSKMPPSQDLTALKAQLTAAIQDYERLSVFISDQKNVFLSQQYSDSMDIIKARRAVQSKLASESFLFPDLLKVALISFFDDTSNNVDHLRTNISALRTYLDGFPAQEPFINLSEISWHCAAAESACLVVQSSPMWREAYLQKKVGSKVRSLPLYILAPLPRQLSLPVFLLDSAAVKIKTIPAPK